MKIYHHNGIRILYNTESTDRFTMNRSHFHDEYEVYCLTGGSRQFYIKDRVFSMTVGSVAFVDGEEMHRTFSPDGEPHTRTVICVKKSILDQTLPQLAEPFSVGGVLNPDRSRQKELQILLDTLKTECETPQPMQDEAIAATVTNLLILILRLYRESAVIQTANPSVNAVIAFIHSHCCEKFSLADICAACNISGSHLTRLFKASTGYTVVEYTNNLRMKQAAKLLKTTSLSVSEVAMRVGFFGFSYFSKLFANCYGITPLRYQKQFSASVSS